jgi:hypothetical protein
MKSFTLFAVVVITGRCFPSVACAVTATGLSSFEGIEEPSVRYAPATSTFTPDDFVNITDEGEGVFRTRLRYRPEEWDGDRDTPNRDRQRAEVKGLGPHQKDGETFDYTTTWRTNDSFQGANRFCHFFQLKATNGDNGAPLVTASIQRGTSRASVHHWSGEARSSTAARQFAWKPGTWQALRIRIKPSTTNTGELLASIDGDALQGAQNIPLYRPQATAYRPKWGLYRGASAGLPLGDDYVEHSKVTAEKLDAPTDPAALTLELSARKTAESDLAGALSWLQEQPASLGRSLAIASTVALWAEKEPAKAMQWAEKLPASEGRADAVQRVFNRWSDQDVDAAVDWLKTQKPSAELDPLLWFFMTDTTHRYVDRTKVLVCAPLVADPDLRAEAIEHVVLIWARRERADAARYIEELTILTPEQKAGIQKKFPTGRR